MSDVCWLGRLAWARLPGLGEAGCLGRNRLAWAWARPAAWARRARLGEAGYAGRLGRGRLVWVKRLAGSSEAGWRMSAAKPADLGEAGWLDCAKPHRRSP